MLREPLNEFIKNQFPVHVASFNQMLRFYHQMLINNNSESFFKIKPLSFQKKVIPLHRKTKDKLSAILSYALSNYLVINQGEGLLERSIKKC